MLDGEAVRAARVAEVGDDLRLAAAGRLAGAAVAFRPAGEVARDRAGVVGLLAAVGDDVVGGAVDLEDGRARGRGAAVERAVAAGDGGDRDDVVELAADAGGEPAAVGDAGGEDAVGAGQRERLGEERAQVVEVGRAHLVVEAPELVRGGARVEHGEAVAVGGVGEAGPAGESVARPAGAVEGEHEPDRRLGRDVQERVAEPVRSRLRGTVSGRRRCLRRVGRVVGDQRGDAQSDERGEGQQQAETTGHRRRTPSVG